MSRLKLGICQAPAQACRDVVPYIVLLLAISSCRPRTGLAVESGRASDSVELHDAGADAMGLGDAGSSNTAPAPSAEVRTVLETFDAAPHTYELSILHGRLEPHDGEPDAASDSFDPFSLRLFKSGRSVDQLTLQASSCGQPNLEPESRVRGADREAKAWSTSDEHCEIGVAARSVALSGTIGLLVTVAAGFEYRYSGHHLYVVQDERLHDTWSFQESTTSEDHTSTSVLATREPNRQDVAFVHVRRGPTRLATKVSAQRLRFDAASKQIVTSALPDEETPLYVLAVGSFTSTKTAFRLASECLRALDLLQGSFFPELHAPRLYFGAVFARRADAEAAAAELAQCPELPKAKILEQRSTRGKAHGADQ